MPFVCKKKCDQFKTDSKISIPTSLKYIVGKKKCTVCNVWMFYDDVYCPCCGVRLSTTPKRKIKNNIVILKNNDAYCPSCGNELTLPQKEIICNA